MVRRQSIAIASFASASVLAACQFVAGIERIDKGGVETPFVDGGDSNEVSVPVPATGPCDHASLPAPPVRDDDPARELPTIVMAMNHFSLSGGSASRLGIDLDQVCTCDTHPTTAHGGEPSCVRKGAPICDDDGGVDNYFATAVASFSSAFNLDDFAGVNSSIQLGHQNALIVLRKYNGLANDRDVEVGIVETNGIRSSNCPDSIPTIGSDYYSPGWCGDDQWSVFPNTTVDGFPISYAAGYVNDYQLVVSLDRGIAIPFGDVGMTMGSPVSLGTLVPLGEDLQPRDPTRSPATDKEARFYRLDDGLIAGRVAATDLLAAAGSATLPPASEPGASARIPPSTESSRSKCVTVSTSPKRASSISSLDMRAMPFR
ncbi:hypothetical protein AKJ09_05738 [Labilithrix luteola]|uniref:Uncharacterized protein n=1 Tax=Labilithrix luteola TaxID=1391654 RepID=A0A0K1Q0Y7_9BACT|nr:hypothetical protein [Labilithrix luteola]AKU99074.1 hypothetical protein AKJ09_05738 [Labilithrix luteola]